MKKIILITASIAILICSNAPVAYGVTVPSFPSCLNPQGTLKAQYDSGTHGIVADTKVYTGRDEVYKISDDTLIQCFCPTDGNGIQTNWWRTPDFTVSQIQSYQSVGWNLVPDGYKWGLSSDQYLAKNTSYSCIGGTGGGDPISKGEVLALAMTGNLLFISSTALFGIILIGAGIFVDKKTNKRS